MEQGTRNISTVSGESPDVSSIRWLLSEHRFQTAKCPY